MPRRLLERSGSTQRFDVSGSTQRTRRALGSHGLPFVPPDCQPSTSKAVPPPGTLAGASVRPPQDLVLVVASVRTTWRYGSNMVGDGGASASLQHCQLISVRGEADEEK